MSENQGSPANEMASARLVAALRAEIEELDQNVEALDLEPEFTLPPGLRRLVETAPLPVKIAAAVDEVVADVAPLPEGLATSLKASVREAQARRGTRLEFLEQLVAHARTERSVTLDAVAAAVGTEPAVVADVEQGRRSFDFDLDEEAVANWIRFLELEFDTAIKGLDRSLHSPALSYAGDPDEHGRKANEFVEKVRKLLFGL